MLQDPLMTMSDENLAAIVAEVRTVTPSAGESLVTGSLRSQGYHVSRERVREALRSSDPLRSALQWPGVSTVFTEGLSVAYHVGLLFHKSVSESVWNKGMPFSVMVNVRKLPYI